MQIQNIEFPKLKSFLSSIEISDELACFDINEDYDEVLRTKKQSDLTTWIPTFNRKSSELFFTTFKKLQDAMFKEISVNRLLKIDKNLIHIYFKDLYNFFTEISNKITYDILLKKWTCGFSYFNDQFLQNKLNEHFNQKIQYFYKELNDNQTTGLLIISSLGSSLLKSVVIILRSLSCMYSCPMHKYSRL